MTLDWKMHRNDETVKGHFLCVAARANSHGDFFVFVSAFPCPVSVAGWDKAYFFALPTSSCHLFTLHYYLFPKTVGEALEPPATRYDLATWSREGQDPPLHGNSVLRMEFGGDVGPSARLRLAQDDGDGIGLLHFFCHSERSIGRCGVEESVFF